MKKNSKNAAMILLLSADEERADKVHALLTGTNLIPQSRKSIPSDDNYTYLDSIFGFLSQDTVLKDKNIIECTYKLLKRLTGDLNGKARSSNHNISKSQRITSVSEMMDTLDINQVTRIYNLTQYLYTKKEEV